MEPPAEFRWQAFFRHSRDPLFLLNRQRRLLFVNSAWEALTGLGFSAVRGLACTRRKSAVPSPFDAVAPVLCPPPEVLRGQAVHVRRPSPDQESLWEIDFLPFRADGEGTLGILGRITAVSALEPLREPLPEELLALRTARVRRYGLEGLESSIPAVRRAAEQARVAAPTTASVLLIGEPGVGKRWLARVIHQLGPRRDQPFAVIDCVRLPTAALEQALFGPMGLLSTGTVGTLYLQEPGRLPRDLQARLVEVLTEPPTTLPRIMAGTTLDLAAAAASLRVLEDFRCLLATLVIELPPLRRRLADLPLLVETLLRQAAARDAAPSQEPPTLTTEAWDLLRSHGWPGNLRELYAVLACARQRAVAGRIGAAELPASLRLASQAEHSAGARPERTLPLATILEEVERRLIQMALRRTGGNKTRAAELLEIWKPLLYRRMAALGLSDEGPEKKG
jgi:DNA-binding NtrC family response regulator